MLASEEDDLDSGRAAGVKLKLARFACACSWELVVPEHLVGATVDPKCLICGSYLCDSPEWCWCPEGTIFVWDEEPA